MHERQAKYISLWQGTWQNVQQLSAMHSRKTAMHGNDSIEFRHVGL